MPPDPEFFADRNLGKKFVARLTEAGFTVYAHDDSFGQKTDDVDWIPKVSEKGWIILTGDKTQARDVLEIACHIKSGSRTFISGGKMTSGEFSEVLVNNKHRLLQYIGRAERRRTNPYIVRVSRPDEKKLDKRSKLILWMDEQKWESVKKKKGIK